ncbi:zinc ribbon domain-containing protein [Actinokineospora sp.]|uniref:zinc ribbon domain-containing protein n=1 Tax=Actinokineospora sp. TaxID=1872133 RepID=UPI00403767EC
MRRSRAAGGLPARRKLERGPKATKHVYALRGRVRCGYCQRRMEGSPRQTRIYYRCAARSIVPGSPVLAEHPKNVYLPEIAVLDQVNDWLSKLFNRKQRDDTVRRLLGAGADKPQTAGEHPARKRLTTAETKLRRLQDAIEAGANPAALVDAINRAQEECDAARMELERTPAARVIGLAEVEARVDQLAELAGGLRNALAEELREFYDAVNLDMLYNAEDRLVDVTIRPSGRGSERVRGGT